MLDFLWRKADCPECRQPDARVFLWMAKCRNPICRHFAAAPSQEPTAAPPGGPAVPPGRESAFARIRRAFSTTFDPGADAIEIRYRNRKGEEKSFRGDKTSLRVAGRHISLRLAPSGDRVALAKDRILNLREVEAALPPGPYPDKKERRVLLYGDPSSPRYQELEKRFPDWE